MALRYGGTDFLLSTGSEWIKTARGWVLKRIDNVEFTPTYRDARIGRRPNITQNDRESSQARNVKVIGTKLQRRITICLSDLLQHLDLNDAITDLRRQTYVYDVMSLLMVDQLSKTSGTTNRQLFKMLESMVNEAINSELHVDRMKVLLVNILKSIVNETSRRIGSTSLWCRHRNTVTNLCTKMEQFSFTAREDDGQLCLTDLPKECIRDIMLRLPDHRDILHLGQTCSELYYMSQDSSIWQKLTQYYFSEKQMLTFINVTDDVSESAPWQQLYQSCYKKYGIKVPYTDKLVICSACKTLHWMMLGHDCWSDPETVSLAYLDTVMPGELVMMVNI